MTDSGVAAQPPPTRRARLGGLRPDRWPLPAWAAIPPVVIGLALYWRTLLPGLGVWDNAEFQAIGPVLGIAHPTGYPTYTLLAWLASVVLQPFGDEAYRANLLSALLVAAATGLLAATVTAISGRLVAGIAAGIALALAEHPWRIALAADPHALHVLFVALLLALLAGWLARSRAGRPADGWLLSAAVVYGLSLGNHALTVLLAPGIALFVFAAAPRLFRRPLFVAACAGVAALTALAVYMYLPIRSAMDPPLDYANPQTLEGFTYVVLGQQFAGTFQAMPPLDVALADFARWAWRELGVISLAAPFGALFLLLRRPALLLMLGAWVTLTWLFSLGYINAAIERYYLGPLVCIALLGGLGAAGLIDIVLRLRPLQRLADAAGRARRRVPEVAETASWGGTARVAGGVAGRYGANASERFLVGLVAGLLLLVPPAVAAPTTFARVDISDDHSARQWVESVVARLEANAVVISWWSYSTPLWYVQFVEGRRPDVYVVDDRTILDEGYGTVDAAIERYLGNRPVYVIRLPRDLAELAQRYRLVLVAGVAPMWGGQLHRVEGRQGGG